MGASKNSLYSWVSSFYPFNKQYLYAIASMGALDFQFSDRYTFLKNSV